VSQTKNCCSPKVKIFAPKKIWGWLRYCGVQGIVVPSGAPVLCARPISNSLPRKRSLSVASLKTSYMFPFFLASSPYLRRKAIATNESIVLVISGASYVAVVTVDCCTGWRSTDMFLGASYVAVVTVDCCTGWRSTDMFFLRPIPIYQPFMGR